MEGSLGGFQNVSFGQTQTGTTPEPGFWHQFKNAMPQSWGELRNALGQVRRDVRDLQDQAHFAANLFTSQSPGLQIIAHKAMQSMDTVTSYFLGGLAGLEQAADDLDILFDPTIPWSAKFLIIQLHHYAFSAGVLHDSIFLLPVQYSPAGLIAGLWGYDPRSLLTTIGKTINPDSFNRGRDFAPLYDTALMFLIPWGRIAGVTRNGSRVGLQNGPAHNAANYAQLKQYLEYAKEYGTGGIKYLENGRYRFYESIKPARTPGEMQGARIVHEWDPISGCTRTWNETIDHFGRVRIVAPKPPTGPQNHRIFDADGNYQGLR